MSCGASTYPRDMFMLDDRYWAKIGNVTYGRRGMTFEQFLIARNPAPGAVGKDGRTPRPFQMGIPIRCMQALYRVLAYIMDEKNKKKQ